MLYDNTKSFIENVKGIIGIVSFVIMMCGMFSTAAFFYLDDHNDQRYLKLLEISTKLDPIYVSIDSYKEQHRVEEIRILEDKIFNIEFKKSTLASKSPPRLLEPLDSALLGRYKSQLITLRVE